MCNLFGGASSSEESSQEMQSELARSLQSNYKEMFGQQQDTLAKLNSTINRIQSGQTGPGFGAAEENARESQIIANAGAAERNAQQATQNRAAGQQFAGAGDASGLAHASGIRNQINAEIAASGENQKSAALNENTARNYEQGRLNAAQTEGGLSRLAGLENPLGYASGASGANEGAFKMAEKINEENSSGGLFGSLLSAGVGLAGKLIPGSGIISGIKGLFGGGGGASGASELAGGGFSQVG